MISCGMYKALPANPHTSKIFKKLDCALPPFHLDPTPISFPTAPFSIGPGSKMRIPPKGFAVLIVMPNWKQIWGKGMHHAKLAQQPTIFTLLHDQPASHKKIYMNLT